MEQFDHNGVRPFYNLIRLQQPQPNNAVHTLVPNPPTLLGSDNCL